MKGVFVILDGVADEPCHQFQGKTPLDVANTANLDHLARESEIFHCYPVKEGVIPESSSAVVSLLGYDPDVPRGPLEARGAGIKITRGDLCLRCNFATLEDFNSNTIIDSRAGRTLTTAEARQLAKAIKQHVKLKFDFDFVPTIQHRAVLVFRGGFSDNISNADPYYSGGQAVRNPESKFIFSHALDDEQDSKVSAELLNNFIRQSHAVLDKHPVNVARVRKGLYSANVILCRDPGNAPVNFKKLKGKWMALGYNPLEIGIAEAAKMHVYRFKYEEMKGFDVYAHLHEMLQSAISNAIKMLSHYWKSYDYFYIHIKETDIPGHDNKPYEKKAMIETIDKRLFSFLIPFVKKHSAKLVVTADHTTACRLKAHSDKPVPVLYYSGNKEEKEQRFSEEFGLQGPKVMGRKLLERTILH
ncbi:MAG: alkaline phosphatase family protein [Nanoarchaeota archaeon]